MNQLKPILDDTSLLLWRKDFDLIQEILSYSEDFSNFGIYDDMQYKYILYSKQIF